MSVLKPTVPFPTRIQLFLRISVHGFQSTERPYMTASLGEPALRDLQLRLKVNSAKEMLPDTPKTISVLPRATAVYTLLL